jgi:hypothetical protein
MQRLAQTSDPTKDKMMMKLLVNTSHSVHNVMVTDEYKEDHDASLVRNM